MTGMTALNTAATASIALFTKPATWPMTLEMSGQLSEIQPWTKAKARCSAGRTFSAQVWKMLWRGGRMLATSQSITIPKAGTTSLAKTANAAASGGMTLATSQSMAVPIAPKAASTVASIAGRLAVIQPSRPSRTGRSFSPTATVAVLKICDHSSPRSLVSAVAAAIVSLPFTIEATRSSVAKRPSRIAAARSGPARRPNVLMLSPTGSADAPIASILVRRASPMSAAFTPSPASVFTPNLRPESIVSVLTPSFSHLPSSAADSSKEKPSRRIGAPKSTTSCWSRSTPIPVSWLARKTSSSVFAWSCVAIDQSPNSRVEARTLSLTSVFVIRQKSRRLTARSSSVSPVAPVRVLSSAITAPTVARSSGTRFAARPNVSTRPSSALPVAPVPARIASTPAS